MNREVYKDAEHLKILSICFYVLSGLTLFPVLFGLIYIVFGIFFGVALSSVETTRPGEAPPPAFLGGFFIVFGLIFAGIFGTLGVLILKAGRNLSKRQGYTFCFVVACLVCLWMPLGTVLGIFTIIVLTRDSVKALFEGRSPQQFGAAPPHNWQ
ncbi:MAG TPA: hypothetical protein VIL74_24165 [Pyrinomonadaceae bacterium]|jgi:hypothetical protein